MHDLRSPVCACMLSLSLDAIGSHMLADCVHSRKRKLDVVPAPLTPAPSYRACLLLIPADRRLFLLFMLCCCCCYCCCCCFFCLFLFGGCTCVLFVVHPSIDASIHPSIHPSIHHPSIHPSIHPCMVADANQRRHGKCAFR